MRPETLFFPSTWSCSASNAAAENDKLGSQKRGEVRLVWSCFTPTSTLYTLPVCVSSQAFVYQDKNPLRSSPTGDSRPESDDTPSERALQRLPDEAQWPDLNAILPSNPGSQEAEEGYVASSLTARASLDRKAQHLKALTVRRAVDRRGAWQERAS